MKKTIFILILMTLPATVIAKTSNLERSKEFFTKFDIHHLDLADGFYDENVVFQDPVHTLKGSQAVKRYYENLYKNVDTIRFEFFDSFESGSTVSLTWRMYLTSKNLNGGKEVTVDGVSLITFGGNEGKAISHRDYFDMGEFIYERIPLLGTIIRYIKKRLVES